MNIWFQDFSQKRKIRFTVSYDTFSYFRKLMTGSECISEGRKSWPEVLPRNFALSSSTMYVK